MKNYTEPSMHSAEHILNQTMVRMFDCGRCFSSHIEKKISKCDYRFDRDLSAQELQEIEKRVNGIIQQDLPVSEEFLSINEAASCFNLDRLPAGAKGPIRIVKIGDYDACPCIGDHVAATRTIGTFSLASSSHNDGVLRLRFKISESSFEQS